MGFNRGKKYSRTVGRLRLLDSSSSGDVIRSALLFMLPKSLFLLFALVEDEGVFWVLLVEGEDGDWSTRRLLHSSDMLGGYGFDTNYR